MDHGLSGPFAPEDEYISESKNKKQEKEREALEKEQKRQDRKRKADEKRKQKEDKQHKKHNKKVKKKTKIPKSDSESDAEIDTLYTKCNMPYYFDEENAPWTACRSCHNWYHA